MDQPVFASNLKEAIQRALSSWLASAFMLEIISYADLVKCFGVKELITSLSPDVRGKVFCACNGGGDAARAAKIDAESVALMVSSMLKDVIVDEALICKEISTDHMVEVLPNDKLYSLIFGGAGKTRPWDGDGPACKRFMAAAHDVIHTECLLDDKNAKGEVVVTTPENYIKELGIEKIVHEKTPTELLVLGQLEAVRLHREGKTFAGTDFIGIYAPEQIVGYVALTDLFSAIEAVAKRHGWIKADEGVEANAGTGIPTEALDSIPPEASEANASDEDAEPEISVSGSASAPSDMEFVEVETDDLEELDSSDEDGASDGASDASSPPPLGKRRRDRRHADGN